MIFKKRKNEVLKLDQLEQYDPRQNLEIIGVSSCNNEDVKQIVMDPIGSLNLNIVEGISIAQDYHLSLDNRP